ncbi:MAG TPA: hypothetical protein VK815_10480 [Candidatus Acidoferrales bacterium]|nr:hypothetical protein [Candidatus Acidoferrales bacterium]
MKTTKTNMKSNWKLIAATACLLAGFCLPTPAADAPNAAVQAKIDAKLKEISVWAADPTIVSAVKAHNTSVPADQSAMTQDAWKALSVMDPFVRGFTKNDAAQFLKGKKGEVVSEAFISGADGLKVAFLSKPTNWSHKGKAKHDDAMAGKNWQGPVELDESTGLQQVQVSVPVMDEGKAIGSLVVGLSLSKLE